MNDLTNRVETLSSVFQQVYGVCTTVCSRDSFAPLHTNAADANIISTLIWLDEPCRALPEGETYLPGKLYFYANTLGMIWLFIADEEQTYLLGPAFTDNYSVLDILEKLGSYKLSPQLATGMREFLKVIPTVSTHRMTQLGQMLYSGIYGEAPHMEDTINIADKAASKTTSAAAYNRTTDYILEQRVWKVIREGNLNYQKELENSISNINIGVISNGESLRQDKNQAIVLAAMACRAAVEGGLSPEIAYPLSDQYLQRVEACGTASEVTDLSAEIMHEYIRRVHETKLHSEISPQIRACCSQISMYPEEDVDLQLLAKRYGYTPYYFSKKFKQETGMTVTEFAARQKIERAMELLRQRKLTISDISERLGFNSQSYFGSVFRKYTGMTPTQFQEGGCVRPEGMKQEV